MGLPDVQGWQQQMMESFTNNLQNSQEQQQEFVTSLLTGAFAPWQNFVGGMNGFGNVSPPKPDNK